MGEMDAGSALAVRGVRKTFESENAPVRALRGVDLEVSQNDFVALMGPSGCGKSTLLRSLNRINDLIPSFTLDGEVRMGLIDEILHAVPAEKVLFEAPLKDQQVWFVRRVGPDVNLGNISAEETLSLETIRVGLRADTAVAHPDDE